MKIYSVVHYDQEGNRRFSVHCKRIDIITSHSLYYYAECEHVYRIFSDVISVNVERGIITVYYCDSSYIIITEKK